VPAKQSKSEATQLKAEIQRLTQDAETRQQQIASLTAELATRSDYAGLGFLWLFLGCF
jgi:ferritin